MRYASSKKCRNWQSSVKFSNICWSPPDINGNKNRTKIVSFHAMIIILANPEKIMRSNGQVMTIRVETVRPKSKRPTTRAE